MQNMGDLLDLDRFPIDRPESDVCGALLETCRAALERVGMFNLEDVARVLAGKYPEEKSCAFPRVR